MKLLAPRQRAAQLIVVRSFGDLPPSGSRYYRQLQGWVTRDAVGGIIVVNRVGRAGAINAQPFEMATFLNRMQKAARIPLLIGGDFERGASMRVAGTVKYPHLMAYAAAGDLALTRQLGAATARESRALGVHWVFAPASDVNNNPKNPIINIRSFAEDPKVVAEHVKAFIEGARSETASPVLLTAKHFPGHGDTAVDSHTGLPVSNASIDRLNAIELIPFRSAIAAGVDSIMTAHISLPAIDPTGVPATISKPIINGLLRERLGFEGLVTTDAMDMAGLAADYDSAEASVRAIEAGADVLLMPPDPTAAVDGLMHAVQRGRLTQDRVDASVRKVLAAKLRLGLDTNRLVDLDALPEALASAADMQAAQQTADKAVTLVSNPKGILPISRTANACVLLLAERRGNANGQAFLDEMRERAPSTPVTLLDPLIPPAGLDQAADQAAKCDIVVIAAFAQLGGYRGGAPLPQPFPKPLWRPAHRRCS